MMQGETSSGGFLAFLAGIADIAKGFIPSDKPKTTSTPKTDTTSAWLMPVLLIGGGVIALLVIFAIVKR